MQTYERKRGKEKKITALLILPFPHHLYLGSFLSIFSCYFTISGYRVCVTLLFWALPVAKIRSVPKLRYHDTNSRIQSYPRLSA